NAARTELDVSLIVAPLALLANLAMSVAQPLVGVQVQVIAGNEWGDQRVELFMTRPGERACLEPRVTFPSASLGNEILLERGKRAGERTGFAVGAEPHVDAKHVAVGRDVV